MVNRLTFQFLIVLTATTSSVVSIEYGPAILSLVRPTSTTIPPASPGSLSFLTTHEPIRYVQRFLRLENFPNHATILPLAEGRSWMKSERVREVLGRESLHHAVPFMVVPPPDHGIMVVIQELQIPAINTFNKTLMVIDDNGNIFECFSKLVFRIEGKSPVHVCGRTDEHDKLRPGALNGVGPRSFVVPVGKSITVSFIYRDEEIDKSASLSKQVPYYDSGFLFMASIAFTAYSACPPGPPYYGENNIKMWPCDIPTNSQDPVGACINEKSFCDAVINCGMHNSKEFAVDERFCKAATNSSSRGKGLALNVPNLEKAIRERIINSERPYGYSEVQWGRPLPQIPGKGNGNSNYYPSDSSSQKDQTSHPAFVALVILISIICVLIIGLIFRYCCKSCVGRVDPFGDSSNPEAVQRFHENFRGRDDSSGGRINGGYGISIDSLFKPVDDLPPAYDDLFPQNIDNSTPFKIQDNMIAASRSGSNMTGIVFTRASQPPQQTSVDMVPPSPPIYTIPIVAQQLQSTSHGFVNRTSSGASNSSEGNLEHCIINPAFVRVEVLPAPMGIHPPSFDPDPDCRRSSNQSTSAANEIEMRRTSEPINNRVEIVT